MKSLDLGVFGRSCAEIECGIGRCHCWMLWRKIEESISPSSSKLAKRRERREGIIDESFQEGMKERNSKRNLVKPCNMSEACTTKTFGECNVQSTCRNDGNSFEGVICDCQTRTRDVCGGDCGAAREAPAK